MLPGLAQSVNRALRCALVAPDTPDRAEPITRLLAQRVKQLREQAGMNQAELAERMSELRPNWSRSTVVKLETFKRQEVSIGDFLALAVVLGVPPPMLLADPRHVETVSFATDMEAPAWAVVKWMIGLARLMPKDGRSSADADGAATLLIHDGWALAGAIAEVERDDYVSFAGDDPVDPDHLASLRKLEELRHKAALNQIRGRMRRILDAGAPLPPIPDYVLQRAKELDIRLPGVEG